MRQTQFEDVCEITGVRNEITVTGEILNFKEKEFISATINRSAKVSLHWNEVQQLYIGSMGGVEFTSPGPKSYSFRTSR